MPIGELARQDEYGDEMLLPPYLRQPETGLGLSPGAAAAAIRKTGEAMAFPGRYMSAIAAERPGELSEEDIFRVDARERAATDFGRRTAFGLVFDPVPGMAGLTRGGSLRGSMGSVGAGAGQGIRAYHSSPHDFERFDLSKIGTGEGAQVYGHGIYAAENPAVSGQGGQYYKQFLPRTLGDSAVRRAHQYLSGHGYDREQAVSAIDRFLGSITNTKSIDELKAARSLLESGKPVGPRTYELNIKARPEEFLDWDKMINRQSPQVTRALEDVYPGMTEAGATVQRSFPYGIRPQISEVLNRGGIPGIRYLDEGSRLQGSLDAARADLQQLRQSIAIVERQADSPTQALRLQRLKADEARLVNQVERPTSNYVIFDPTRIDILRKYGLPLAAGGMGGLAAQDQYQQ